MQSRSTVLEGEGNFNHLRVVEEERKRKETRCRGKRGSGEGRGRHLRGIAIFFKDSERTGLPCPGRRQVAPVSAEFYRRCAHLHPPIHPFVESNFHLRTVFIDCHPSTLDPPNPLERHPELSGNFLFSHPLSPTDGKNSEAIGSSYHLVLPSITVQ